MSLSHWELYGVHTVYSINPTPSIILLLHWWAQQPNVQISNIYSTCWIFPSSLNFVTSLRIFLLYITTTWLYSHCFWDYIVSCSPVQLKLNYLRINNCRWCLQMSSDLFSYIVRFTYVTYYIVFVSHWICFWLSCCFMECIYLMWVFVSMSSSSLNILAMSTETNLLKYFPNIPLLVSSWSTTYKKLERNESNLSGKWTKCAWTKKPHNWRHLYQTVGALGRVHALVKQTKQRDFELVHSGNDS